MKGKINLFLLMLFVIISCSKVEQEFNKAIETNSAQAYKSFIQKYPDSEYRIQAEDKMIFLIWEEVSEQNTIQSFQSFINKFPKSEYCDHAKKNIISISWEEALKENTTDSYSQFLDQYPDSEFSDLALSKYYDLAWKILREVDDEVEYILALYRDNFDYSLTYSMSLRNKIINRLQDIYFPRIEREKMWIKSLFAIHGTSMEKELKMYTGKFQKAKTLISSTNTSDIIQGITIYRSTSLEVSIRINEILYGNNY